MAAQWMMIAETARCQPGGRCASNLDEPFLSRANGLTRAGAAEFVSLNYFETWQDRASPECRITAWVLRWQRL